MDMGKAIKLHNKKTGEALYPITASDMVFDPSTKKSVKDDLAEKIADAPSDGKQYARMNGVWNEVNIPESGIGEAPKDGLQYVRKDGSWAQISPDELCQITLKSNQGDSDAASLIGVSVKVIATEDSSELFNGTWNGETIIVPVTQGKEYKVVVGELEGYATPAEQTYTSSAFVNRDVVMMYNTELVRVTLSADDSSSVSGQIVTINGEEFTYGSTAVEKKVPFGTEYTVSVNDKSGYITPASQTFTASESVRNLEVVYEEVWIGVRIQGVSGKTYAVSSWSEQETVNGIALKTENCGLVISLISSAFLNFVNTSQTDFNLSRLSYSKALVDYNGEGNTNQLLITFNNLNDDYGLYKCYNYIFPNGQRGFVPSFGQLDAIFDNLSAITEALIKVGGSSIPVDSAYISSSRASDDDDGWYCLWCRMDYVNSLGNKYGEVIMSSKYYCRPITTL